MEENNFEKQVRQKMDELKISPSESVWEKIEMRIEKRKLRWILFFIVSLFFIFLAGGYWVYNGHYSTKENYAVNKNGFEKNVQKNPELKNEGKAERINSYDPITTNEKKKDFSTKTQTAFKSSKKYKLKITNGGVLKSAINASQISKELATKEKTEKANDNKSDIDTTFQTPQQTPQSDSTVNDNNISKKKFIEDKAKEKDTLKTVTTIPNKIKLRNNKWEVGFLFAGGISGVGNKFLGLQNLPSADYSNSISGSPGQINRSIPSKTKNSSAFIGGFFIEKNILNKTKLSVGVNFKFFSTTNAVGAKSDSADKAFTSGNQNIYHNHFSLIEFPVELKFQIINSRQFQLFSNVGVTISQLLGSNALQFNENTGYYFIDNTKFNKTKIGLSTGFSANIFQTKKASLLIGSYFSYGLSKLSNESLYDKKHFVFAGLRSEFLFKRK